MSRLPKQLSTKTGEAQSVPEAAERNPALGELLALFDAVRGGSAPEQALLEERLQR